MGLVARKICFWADCEQVSYKGEGRNCLISGIKKAYRLARMCRMVGGFVVRIHKKQQQIFEERGSYVTR